MQTSAQADAKQADMRSKHLQKQLAEQQKGLQSLEKEAVRLQRDLAKEEAAVQACSSRCILRWTLAPLFYLLQQDVTGATHMPGTHQLQGLLVLAMSLITWSAPW